MATRARAVWLLGAALVAATAAAQPPQPPRQQPQLGRGQPQPERLADVKGSLVGLDARQGVIQFIDAANPTGAPHVAKLDPKTTRLIVKGTAHVSVLRPGMFVRFKTEVDDEGQATVDLEELEIFTPKQENEIGIASDVPAATSGPVTVAGQVRSLKKGVMVVAAGRGQVAVRLVEEPKLTLALSDLSLCSPQDEVWVKGVYDQRGMILASTVQIDLHEELTAEKKTSKRARPRPERDERPERAESARGDDEP